MLGFYETISQIADIKIMSVLMALLVVVLYAQGYKKEMYKILSCSVTALFITYSLKYLLKVPRPLNMLVVEDGYRFPSGHATLAAVLMVLGIYYARKCIKDKGLRYAAYMASVLWFVVVSYARIYLGVHIFIDVIVGGFIGAVSTFAVLKAFRHFHYYRK
ncbi:MAG: phosphatase PAP2 family protein [Patescibacteria group bacterium]